MQEGKKEDFVYITGCDSGFGNILTHKLYDLGFSVISGVFLEKTIEDMKSSSKLQGNSKGNKVYPLRVDVTSDPSLQKAADEAERIISSIPGGKLKAIVNNAGIMVNPAPLEWAPIKDFQAMFDVNLLGTVRNTQKFLPLLRKHSKTSQGRVINIASIAGRVGLPYTSAYCATKYAVEGMTESLRKELGVWGISVHLIEPGIFKSTGLYERYETGLDHVWENLDPKLKEEYGESFYKDLRVSLSRGKALGSDKSYLVPEAIVHAVTANKPKYRYRVGLDSKFGITVIEKLHESTQDKILTVPEDKLKPMTAPKKANVVYERNWPRFLLVCALALYLVKKMRS
eukprot:snap_masked-scaffold_8-processed-gene-3.39-mRNA-1 protein AED:0.19 eAED:0.21 QI:0/-1/0/1/-1/1/1/0/341